MLAVAAMALSLSSCSTSKNVSPAQVSKAEQRNPYGEEVFQTKSEKMATEAPGKRAYGKGVSFNESSARQLAETDARAQLSRALETAIVSASKAVGFDITQYSGSDSEGMAVTDGGMQQNTLSKSVSSNIISGAAVINTDKYYGKNRQYTVFVCLEYNGSVADIAKKVTEQIKQRVSDKDRAAIQQENRKFEEEVEKALEQYKQQ